MKWLLPLLLVVPLVGQVPSPQVPLTGNIGSGGIFPLFNTGTISFTTDANRTMAFPEMTAQTFQVLSSVPLTTTRNLVAPNGKGWFFIVENMTTGGQAIQVIGSTGSGVSINNGLAQLVWNDGTNYVAVGPSTSGGSSAGAHYAIQQSDGAGNFVAGSLCGSAGGYLITTCTNGFFANTFNAQGALWHTGLALDGGGTPTIYTNTSINSANIDIRQNGIFNGANSYNVGGSWLGDYNSIINDYVNVRNGTVTPSSEGFYENPVARIYICQNVLQYCNMWQGAITAVSQPVANGPASLTLSIASGAGIRMTNDTLLVDQTAPITGTLTFTRSSAYTPLPVTISGASTTIPVSISGTLNASTTWAPASNLDVTPTLTTFSITTTGAQSNPGDRICFADSNPSIAEPGTNVVSASLSGTTETITAYLMRPHYAGAQVYIGGMCGYAYELTNDTYSGQKYMFEIFGSTDSATLVVGTRSPLGYVTLGSSGPVNIYPSARIITTFPTVGAAPTGTYAQIIPFTGAFAAGATVVNPGVPYQIYRDQQVIVNHDDPYGLRHGDDIQYLGKGENWGYPLFNYTFNSFGSGTTPPVLHVWKGAVGAGSYFQHQLYGGGTGNIGFGGCNANDITCFAQWDTAGPGGQGIYRAPFANISHQYNPQTVTSCSIAGGVLTLNGTFTTTYIQRGMPLFLQGFTDGIGGCQDFNNDGGNFNQYAVLSFNTSTITLSTTHADYAGSANTGVVSQALFDFNGGRDSIKVYAVAATKLIQGSSQVCDASGTISGCYTALTGTTASLGGSSLTSGQCITGTVNVTGAVVGHPVSTSSSDGSLPSPLMTPPFSTVTSTGVVTMQSCAISAVTPAAKTYNVSTY